MALESQILASLFQVISYFLLFYRFLWCIVTALSSSSSSLKDRFLF